MSASPSPQPMYLQVAGTQVFAVLHRVAGTPRDTAVLLCPPFGWEDMLTYRVRRQWAEHLARAGFPTLRIDFPGSGDSTGVPSDPGQLDAWTQAVDGAARWLRRPIGGAPTGDGDGSVGAVQVAVIGIGLGGIVSCRAALQEAPIDELILWAVPARGRTLLRELRTFSALEVANVRNPEESMLDSNPEADGTLAVNGYMLSAETVGDLKRLDLDEVEPSSSVTRRALLLGRDGIKVDKALPGIFEQAGAEVTVSDGPGYGAMMADPLDVRAPVEVFELVSSWLEAGELRHGSPVAEAGVDARARGLEPERDAAGLVSAGLVASEEIVHDDVGAPVRERAMFFDGPGGRIFGVLAQPVGSRRELTALFLNAGIQRRTGPNRMWVETARRWAASGVSTLRIDAAGIGDFDGDATAPARITDFYQPLYVEQARAALQMLTEQGLPPRFMMVGFCSGGYCSAQTALGDERVATVLMINPRTLIVDEWPWRHARRHMREVRERMLLFSTWRRVFRGEIRPEKHLEAGRALLERAANIPAHARGRIVASRNGKRVKHGMTADEPAAHEPIEDLFSALRDRETRVRLMFTGKESLHRELTQKGVLDRMDRWPNLELALLGTPAAETHELTPLWLQRQVHELLDRVLEDELERLGEGATLADLAAA